MFFFLIRKCCPDTEHFDFGSIQHCSAYLKPRERDSPLFQLKKNQTFLNFFSLFLSKISEGRGPYIVVLALLSVTVTKAFKISPCGHNYLSPENKRHSTHMAKAVTWNILPQIFIDSPIHLDCPWFRISRTGQVLIKLSFNMYNSCYPVEHLRRDFLRN